MYSGVNLIICLDLFSHGDVPYASHSDGKGGSSWSSSSQPAQDEVVCSSFSETLLRHFLNKYTR